MTELIDLHNDIETASELDLTEVGLDVYSAHPSTRILMVSWELGDAPIKQWTIAEGRPPREFIEHLRNPNVRKWAHHAQFEHILYSRVWDLDLDIEQWRCTMIWAYLLSLPGKLEDLGNVLLLPEHLKKTAKEGKRLIRKFSMPQKITKKQPHRWRDWKTDPEDWAKFCAYNVQDVVAESFIAKKRLARYEMPQRQWDEWHLDQEINIRGIPMDRLMIANAASKVRENTESLLRRLIEITKLDNPNSGKQFGPWIRAQGYPYFNLKKATVQKVLDDPEMSHLHEVLTIRSQLMKTSVKKYITLDQYIGEDDRLRFTLQFAGASRTQRWAGRGPHYQNPPRPDPVFGPYSADIIESVRQNDWEWIEAVYGDAMKPLSSVIRGAVRAPDGYELVIADYAQIEARFVAWYARCLAMLDVFRSGRDIYRAFGIHLYHKEYDDISGYERQNCKPPVLGCFAADTQVLTRRGWISIVEVSTDDQLFDGAEWVGHSGVAFQGVKDVIEVSGVTVTPDHLVLTHEGWICAESLARDECMRSALSLAIGQLRASREWWRLTENAGIECFANANAADSLTYIDAIWRQVKVEDASDAPMLRSGRASQSPVETDWTGKPSSGYQKFSTRSELGVLADLRSMNATANAESNAASNRRNRLSSTVRRLKDGANRLLRSIGSITTGITKLAIFDSLHARNRCATNATTSSSSITATGCALQISGSSTLLNTERQARSIGSSAKANLPTKSYTTKSFAKARTFDVINAGPRNRFVIRTNAGPIIVHNCGFRLGAGGEYEDPKTGDMKKTGLYGYADSLGIKLTIEQCVEAVAVYREAYPEVVQCWYDLESAAKQVISRGGEATVGYLKFDRLGPFLRMILPNGDALHYLRPAIEKRKTPWGAEKWMITFEGKEEEEGGRKFWGRQATHGGKFMENAAQAGANRLMRQGLMNAREDGFDTAFHLHDEGDTLVKIGRGLTVEKLCAAFCRGSEKHYPGLPLVAEGRSAQVFGK